MIIMHVKGTEKAEGIRRIAARIGEEVLPIGGRELDRTLIGLFTGNEQRRQVKLPLLYQMPELLVFVGMPDAKLDLFLEEYKKADLEPIALKAVSTKHNCNWTVYELITALQAERMAWTN